MLNRLQLKKYRELRGLTTRDVANYCNISQPLIVQVESGTKAVTEYNHDEIINGINKAYIAKKDGTLKKAPNKTKTGDNVKNGKTLNAGGKR